MVVCKSAKPNGSLMIEELGIIDSSIGLAECCDMYRWVIALKPCCVKIQLPMVVKCCDMIVRPWYVVHMLLFVNQLITYSDVSA